MLQKSISLALLRTIITLLFLAFAGCTTGPGEYGYDNPKVRALQREQTNKVIPSKAKRKSLAQTTGSKVFLIKTGEKQSGSSGRGVAISPDGYFLTAYHVVDESIFYLSETRTSPEEEAKLQRDGYLFRSNKNEKRIPGRIVWFDQGADLAIVKFEKKTPLHFRKFKFPVAVGSIISSSDDSGHVAIPKGQLGKNPADSVIGNGPYFSAGKVLFSQLFTHGPGVHTIGSTLVARGGMSGGPIVTAKGELCGILSQIGIGFQQTKDNQIQKVIRSTSRMLPPQVLRAIVKKDRDSR